MKMTRKLLALICACLLGGVVLFSACEDVDDVCEIDEDCLDGEACVDELCLEICEDDDDCLDGDECVPRPDGEGDEKVCVTPEFCEDNEDCGDDEACVDEICVPTCDSDEDCEPNYECVEDEEVGAMLCEEMEFGGECESNDDCRTDEICDLNAGVCEDVDDVTAPYYTVLVEDLTGEMNPDMCPFDPADNAGNYSSGYENDASGASLLWVALVNDATGEVDAYGHSVGFDPDNTTDYNDDTAVFNGDEPEYGRQCPEWTAEMYDDHGMQHTMFRQDTVFTLGCDGWLMVEFEDEDGNRVAIDESHRIEVGLYTPQCGLEDYRDVKWGDGPFNSCDSAGGGYCPVPDDEYYEVSICQGDSVDADDFDDVCQFVTEQPEHDIMDFGVTLPYELPEDFGEDEEEEDDEDNEEDDEEDNEDE